MRATMQQTKSRRRVVPGKPGSSPPLLTLTAWTAQDPPRADGQQGRTTAALHHQYGPSRQLQHAYKTNTLQTSLQACTWTDAPRVLICSTCRLLRLHLRSAAATLSVPLTPPVAWPAVHPARLSQIPVHASTPSPPAPCSRGVRALSGAGKGAVAVSPFPRAPALGRFPHRPSAQSANMEAAQQQQQGAPRTAARKRPSSGAAGCGATPLKSPLLSDLWPETQPRKLARTSGPAVPLRAWRKRPAPTDAPQLTGHLGKLPEEVRPATRWWGLWAAPRGGRCGPTSLSARSPNRWPPPCCAELSSSITSVTAFQLTSNSLLA